MFSVWILETNTAVGDVCELQSRMIAEQEKRTELKRGGIAREAWTIAQLTSQIAVGSPASYLDAADGLTLLLTPIRIQLTHRTAPQRMTGSARA